MNKIRCKRLKKSHEKFVIFQHLDTRDCQWTILFLLQCLTCIKYYLEHCNIKSTSINFKLKPQIYKKNFPWRADISALSFLNSFPSLNNLVHVPPPKLERLHDLVVSRLVNLACPITLRGKRNLEGKSSKIAKMWGMRKENIERCHFQIKQSYKSFIFSLFNPSITKVRC